MKKRLTQFEQYLVHDLADGPEEEDLVYDMLNETLPMIGYVVFHFNRLEKPSTAQSARRSTIVLTRPACW